MIPILAYFWLQQSGNPGYNFLTVQQPKFQFCTDAWMKNAPVLRLKYTEIVNQKNISKIGTKFRHMEKLESVSDNVQTSHVKSVKRVSDRDY